MPSLVARVAVAFSAAVFLMLSAVSPPALAGDPKPPCTPGDPNCVVIVVGDPGHPGGGGAGEGGGGGGATPPDPCAPESGYSLIACHADGYVGIRLCVPIYEE